MDLQQLIDQATQFLTIQVMKNGSAILIALVIVLLGFWIAKHIANLLAKALQLRQMDSLLVNFFKGVAYYGLLAVVFIIAAGQAGLDTTSLLTVLGTVGLAVGLALKDNLSNFSSGVMLVMFRPFGHGDFVNVAGVSGSVEAINLFHTILRSPDNQKIIIPNSLIMGDVITNSTGNRTRRIDLVIGIGYGDNIDTARTAISDVLNADESVLKSPEWTIAVSELADSSVNFIVRPWVRTNDYWVTRWRLTESIKCKLDDVGVSIPFPQRDVHMIQE